MACSVIKKHLKHRPLDHELFSIDNVEIFEFLISTTIAIENGKHNEQYTEINKNIMFIREFIREFLVNGLFFVTMIQEFGCTNITGFRNFINYSFIDVNECKTSLTKMGVHPSLLNLITSTTIQTNFNYLQDLYESMLPDEMYFQSPFIRPNDINFSLLYFVLTNQIRLSEISNLSFCKGKMSCFSEIKNYLMFLSLNIDNKLMKINKNLKSYDLNETLMYNFRTKDFNLRRMFINLCCMDYMGLRLIEFWTNKTLKNAQSVSEHIYLKESKNNNNQIFDNIYICSNRYIIGVKEKEIITKDFQTLNHVIETNKNLRVLSLRHYYWSFRTDKGYIFVTYKENTKPSLLFEIEKENQTVYVIKKYLCKSSIKFRTLMNVIIPTEDILHQFDILYWNKISNIEKLETKTENVK